MEADQQDALFLVARAVRFAVEHPFLSSGIFGAAVGSAVTYNVLALKDRSGSTGVFSPKVYEFELRPEDLKHLLKDPTATIRMESPETVVVISAEKREPLKALPDIVQ